MLWRPPEWNNPYTVENRPLDYNRVKEESFEQGADAIIEALRKIGIRTVGLSVKPTIELVNLTLNITGDSNSKPGVVVFIPDDDK